MNKLPILIDFDGVIRLENRPAPDAGKLLKFLSENNTLVIDYPICTIVSTKLQVSG